MLEAARHLSKILKEMKTDGLRQSYCWLSKSNFTSRRLPCPTVYISSRTIDKKTERASSCPALWMWWSGSLARKYHTGLQYNM